MSRHPDRQGLHAFVEGRLDPAATERIGLHIDGCWACAAQLREIDALRAAAHELRGPVAPGRDLWPGIERRVRPRAAATGADPGTHGRPAAGRDLPGEARAADGRSWRPGGRVAAAAVVTLVGAGISLFAGNDGLPGPGPVAGCDPVPAAAPGRPAAARLEERYGPELERLARLVERRSAETGLDVASASEPDLAALRTARAELTDAVERAVDPEPLLATLEATYRREQRYLARLAAIVGS